MNIPENLIFENSKIKISFEGREKLNRTSTAIVVEGNPDGFLSLSNCLIYLANALEQRIDLSQLSFVTAKVGLQIELDESARDCGVGSVTRGDNLNYVWTLSEHDSNSVFTAIHSLAHLNFDLHLDDGKTEGEISVYCSVVS